MRKKVIKNVELHVETREGIRPLLSYSGRGRLMPGNKFQFTENPYHKRVRNVRVAGSKDVDNLYFLPSKQKFRMTLYMTAKEMCEKSISAKAKRIISVAKAKGAL